MKKNILLLLFVFLSSSFSVFAAWNNVTEEEKCFEILTNNVKEQYWIDLSSVEESEESWEIIDLSTYENFIDKTFENPEQRYLIWEWNFFSAKRNNIWTIVASWDYILSQFTWFWNRTDFTFPLKSNNENFDLWDQYPDFRQNIIYTHHLLDWTFVSCGYLNVDPRWTHNLFNIGQNNYKTNVFEWSWFEILDNKVQKWNDEYLVWKVSITAEDYADEDLFKINLITVAYNNKSSYFNEFETFPLQVESMTNPDNQQEWMWWVMQTFFDKVESETCLWLVHKYYFSLPEKCRWDVKSLSFLNNFLNNIKEYLVPSSFARISAVEDYETKMEEAKWLTTFFWLPYELYKKLLSIPDENFKNSLLIALIPNYKNILNANLSNGKTITKYDEIFLNCNLSYTEIVENIIDLLNSIEDVNLIDYKNFSYINKNFWTCVIPYPDKELLDNNDWFARLIKTSSWELYVDINKSIDLLIEEQQKLDEEYNSSKLSYQEKLNAWEVLTDNELEEIQNLDSEYTKKSNEILVSIDRLNEKLPEELIDNEKEINTEVNENISKKLDFKTYLILSIILILSLFFIFLWIRKNNKK